MRTPSDHIFLTIETAAHSGAMGHNRLPEPTEGQKQAGNYKMGRVSVFGLPLVIEQPRNTYRSGIAADGKRWTTRLAAHYGYIAGTRGADGEGVDCFIGPCPQSDVVFVVNQFVNGSFDEHKVMLCFTDEAMARRAYLDSFERGWNGLQSIVPVTIHQFKWWLQNGHMGHPIQSENLPTGKTETMLKRVQWNADAQPYGQTLDRVLYDLRRADPGNLLLDAVSMADILEDSDGVMLLDAMTTPFSQLPRMMAMLKTGMEHFSATVKPLDVTISEPFSARGVANVSAIFSLSDGQNLSVYFHNPDTKPKSIGANDEMISWKWMLNKLDVTIVVAPERGKELNIREVARRIMKLAEKNSAAFQRANGKRAERMKKIEGLKEEVAALEVELAKAQKDLEVAKFLADERAIAKADNKKGDVVVAMGRDFLENKIDGVAATDIWNETISKFEGDTFKASMYIYKEKLQGTYVKTVAGNVLMTGKGGGELRGWAGNRPLLAETIPFIPQILRSATEYEDEPLSKDRKGDFYAFRKFQALQKLPSGSTVKAVIKVGVRSDGAMFYHLRSDEYVLDSAKKEAMPEKPSMASVGEGSPDLLNGYSTNSLMDSIGGDSSGVNIEILEAWDINGNPIDLNEPEPRPTETPTQVPTPPPTEAPTPQPTPRPADSKFRYALVNRPASLGAIPKGVGYEVEDKPAKGQPFANVARHGFLVTDRELTDAELTQFELKRADAGSTDRVATRVAAAMSEYAAAYIEMVSEEGLAGMGHFAQTVRDFVSKEAGNDAVDTTQNMDALVFEKLKAMVPAADAPNPMPTQQQDPARAAAIAMMQAIIDGTTDPLTADLDVLEQAFTSYQDDAEVAALFERAVDVVMNAEAKATEGI